MGITKAGILADFPGLAYPKTPQDLVVFFDDFLGMSVSATDDTLTWLATKVAQAATGVSLLNGTDDAEDEAGGILVLTTEASANDGENLQVIGEMFHFADGYPLYFETRVLVKDASNDEFFIGLSHEDVEIMSGGLDTGVGFLLEAGVLSAHAAFNSDEKDVPSTITEADDDWIRLAYFWDGDQYIYFYVDTNDDGTFDTLVARFDVDVTATYVTQVEMMTPTIEHINGATASAEIMYTDYVLCMQPRFKE